jgi:hypothetical protein
MKKGDQRHKKDFKGNHVILKVREHSFADDARHLNFSSRGLPTN